VPLPWDPSHVVYVWFDALINYLTAAGLEFKLKKLAGDSKSLEAGTPDFDVIWPARVHVIGKDISRFHCVYWPAMLMSLDLPLPKSVFAHGFISIGGDRMSKSSGNMVTPDEVMAWSGSDPFRYYLLAENQFSQDGNFSQDLLVLKNNADLSNDWGNLVNRSISMTRKYFPDTVLKKPATETHSRAVRESFEKLPGELDAAIQAMDPQAYSKACTDRSRVLNLYIDQTKPWGLSKLIIAGQAEGATAEAAAASRDAETQLREVLYTLLEGIRWVATGLLPVLPSGMPKVFAQLAIPAPAEKGGLAALKWGGLEYKPGEPSPIYPRLEMPLAEGEVAPAAAPAKAPKPPKGEKPQKPAQ
jgi:methionyl-tRNA synthetase